MKRIRIIYNWTFDLITKNLRLNKQAINIYSQMDLEKIVNSYDTALIHAGLKSIKTDSAYTAFKTINDAFSSCKTIAIPAFTPSFRKSGIFSRPFSKPEVGKYSKLNHQIYSFRTVDPIHSLFILGDHTKFDNCLGDTFHPYGVFQYFCQAGACWVNIGTGQIVSAVLHYIERLACVPYLEPEKHQGVIYYDESKYKQTIHFSYKYNIKVAWNRKKIERFLFKNGCMKCGYWKGSFCRIIDGQKAKLVLLERLKRDPYFLVY